MENHGKSQFFTGELTFLWPFSIAMWTRRFRSQVTDVKLTADVITYSAAMSACNQADQWQSLGLRRMFHCHRCIPEGFYLFAHSYALPVYNCMHMK